MAARSKSGKAAKKEPMHPLKINGKDWDRQRVADIVCEKIASSAKSVTKILAEGWEGHSLPDYTTFMQWLREEEALSHKYARAKEDQGDFLADDLVDVADEHPPVDGENGKIDSAWLQWQRNRIDARKWAAAKLRPKKYGDKLELDGEVKGGHTVIIKDFTGTRGDD